MNLGPINQSLILAGESAEVDVLARRAVAVPSDSGSRQVALQFTSVATESSYADLSRNVFMSTQSRSPIDLYRRVQQARSARSSAQILDVFA